MKQIHSRATIPVSEGVLDYSCKEKAIFSIPGNKDQESQLCS